MNDFAKKQVGYKTLRKRLKSRERAIQRLKNKITWLELQLTLHYVEDRRAQDSDEVDVPDVWGDDCIKCQQLRNMLDTSIQLSQIPELSKLEDCSLDVLSEPLAVVTDPESTTSSVRQDVTLTIGPSHHSLSLDQQGDASNLPPEPHGYFSRETSGNICCIFIVAMAFLLVNWI